MFARNFFGKLIILTLKSNDDDIFSSTVVSGYHDILQKTVIISDSCRENKDDWPI